LIDFAVFVLAMSGNGKWNSASIPQNLMVRLVLMALGVSTVMQIIWMESLRCVPSQMISISAIAFFVLFFISSMVMIIIKAWYLAIISLMAVLMMLVFMVLTHKWVRLFIIAICWSWFRIA
jgi:hypothetical protein